jgi:putative mRNA 3-end processing factor
MIIMSREVTLEVHGAGQEVGRSSFVLNSKEEHILLDYGVKLTPGKQEYPTPINQKLNAVVLSHAHFDHSGFIPQLFLKNPCPVYMTPPTLELSKLLWEDSIKIAEQDGTPPLYSKNEIRVAEQHVFPMQYQKPIDITMNTRLEFFDAGHILGSAMSKLTTKNKTIAYTGDFMVPPIKLQDGANVKGLGKADCLIIESTYGNRNHADWKQSEKEFVEKIYETLDRGGHCVIAAFAIGRSQEVLDILFEHGVDAPVFLDGMGRKVTEIYHNFPSFNSKPQTVRRILEQVNIVKHPGIRKQALREPSVIVTTAGMLEGGPVLYYLDKLHSSERNSLLLTGYQVEGTKGRNLLETGKIEVDSGFIEPKMEIQRFDFSTHSGKDSLVKTIKDVSPEHVVLIHGDKKISRDFAEELKGQGYKVSNPAVGETVAL